MAEGEVIYSQSEKSDFKRFFYKYLRYWYLFLVSSVLCLGLAILYLKIAAPKYLITSSLLIRDIDKGPDFQSGNPVFKDLDIFNSATSIENEIEALKSATLLERVLKELSLETSYYVPDGLKKREIYGRDLPIRVLISRLTADAYKRKIAVVIKNNNQFQLEDSDLPPSTHGFGQSIRKPYGTFTVLTNPQLAGPQPKKVFVAFHSIQDLVDGYSKDLTVAQANKKANVLTVSLVDEAPQKGIDIVNKIVEVYNEENKEDRNRLASNTIGFIDDRLKDLTSDLSNTERSVEQFKRRNQVTDVRSEASAYLEESRAYNKQLADLNIQLDVVQSLEKYLSRQNEQFQLVPSTLRIDEPTLLELVGRFNELQLQRERLLRSAEPDNPVIVGINGQLSNLRLNILENLRNLQRQLEVTRGGLSAKVNNFQSRINQIPSIERGLNSISRQEGVKRDLYVYLLQKREESALSLAATGSNTRVLDPAIASQLPVNPKKPVVYGLAIALGLLLPFGFIFLRDFLADKVQRKKDISNATYVPVIGELMHYGKYSKKRPVAISQTSKIPIADQFRLIRTNLDYAASGRDNQVILVTSTIPGEGKTVVGINLSISLSLTGKKVVLLDANLRHPGIASGLGLQNEVGLTNFLDMDHSGVSVGALIQSTPLAPYLSVIPTGPIPLNPTEFMMSPRMGQLITKLRERFDIVVIDSAPVGKVADTFSMAPYIDTSLFVVRYNFTPRAQVDIINDIAATGKLKHPMILLNDARKENSPAMR